MKKGEKRRQELIRIAYRMFISKGYEQTSVDEIIDAAGIAKGTVTITSKARSRCWRK